MYTELKVHDHTFFIRPDLLEGHGLDVKSVLDRHTLAMLSDFVVRGDNTVIKCSVPVEELVRFYANQHNRESI